MNILLFGISNVGKSSTGKVLAQSLGFDFYDLDDEVKKAYGITLEEFASTGNLKERDCKRCCVLKDIISKYWYSVMKTMSFTKMMNTKMNIKTTIWKISLKIRNGMAVSMPVSAVPST